MSPFDSAPLIRNLKNNVVKMLQERSGTFSHNDNAVPAVLWAQELSTYDYIINLSEENFLNIRYHTSLFTGEAVYTFWHQHPPLDPKKFAGITGYDFLTQDVPQQYWLSEPPVPKISGPLGVSYKGKIINRNIARYQSCISNLYSMGILKELSEAKEKNLVVEIGGGYGGLAHSLGGILGQKATYVILDFPEMLLFSGGFLIVNNPGKRIYIYEKATFTSEFLAGGILEYDYVLLPNYVLKDLAVWHDVRLLINMASFQEMAPEQIDAYCAFGRAAVSGYVYSDNMDKHPVNKSLEPGAVSNRLEASFSLFPSPSFYAKSVNNSSADWFYKCYLGVTKNKTLIFPGRGPFKFFSGENKIGGSGYALFYRDGKVDYKVRGSFTGHLVSLARTLMKKMLREDIKIYYQALEQ